MNVLVSGSTGLVGTRLVPFLNSGGHPVTRLTRATTGRDEVSWDPDGARFNADSLPAIDAVVHLAGENIAGGRWTNARKRRIRDSRANGTRLLAETLAKLPKKPAVLVSASAIGFYGSRGDERLNEASPAGADYLAGVCRDWEAATIPASTAGIRVVHLRFGVILSPAGGALGKMLLPFRMGVGGRIGDGRQYMSWVAIDDVLGAIHHALITPTLAGPVNVVAPLPATNADYTRTLGKVLSRPTVFPMPAFAARFAFGEMADALLLSSQRVEPRELVASGYRFQYSELEPALRHVLGRA